MDSFRVKLGQFLNVYSLAKPNGVPIYRDELYGEVDETTWKKIVAIIDFLANTQPPIANAQRCKKLKGHNGLFELRVTGAIEVRLFFFYHGNRAIVTHGFIKKSQKTPEKEIKRAEKLRKDFLNS